MSEKLSFARVFVAVDGTGKAMKLGDTVLNALVTDRDIPTSASTPAQAWKQLQTKGEVAVDVSREFAEVGNDQQGATGLYLKKTGVKVTIPLSVASFAALLEYAKLDPTAAAGATAGDYKENAGVKMSDSGVTLLIYDKSTDPDNDLDVPDFVSDPNAQVFFNAVVQSNVKVPYNGEQDVLTLEFTPLANTTSGGSAKGKKGSFGTFAVAV